MKRLIGIITLLIAAMVQTGLAADWYVSWTGGNDNNSGSFSSPWRTINYALQQGSRIRPGDTIWLRAGTYVETIVLDNGTVANGTPDSLITIRAYENAGNVETVILQGSLRVYANTGGSDYGINHRYMNFRITGSNTDGYRFSGDKATAVTEFINMEIDHHRCSGLYFGYGTQSFGTIRIINTKIHDNPPGHINGSAEGNSGIILSSRGRFEIEDCQIYENGDRTFSSFENKGINVQNQPGYTGHVKRTTIYNNVETGMDCPLVNGLIEDCIFYYNGMMDTVEVGPGDENGDSNLSMQSSGGGNIIRGCLFYNSGRYSLNIMNDNNVVYNCTLVDTLPYEKQSIQEDRAPLYLDPNSSGNIIKNCVIANYVPYVPGSDPDLYLAVLGGLGSGNSYLENHLDNNEYYAPHHPTGKFIKIAGMSSYNLPELRAAFPNSGSDVHSISNNPLFVNQNVYNYQITNGSPCVNAGTTQISGNITIPAPEYNGNAPDIGYWETGTPVVNTPPWINPTVPNFMTQQNAAITFDLTAYKHDFEQSGNELVWSASGLNPSLASASIFPSTDVLTITPVNNATGSDVFTLILSDGQGGLDSQSVTLTVTPPNDPPWIDPVIPNFVTHEDSTITFSLTAYEHDSQQTPAQLTWSVSGLNATLATASVNNATDLLTLTPAANQNGSDVFTLILSDGLGGLDSQSVTLTVTPVNDPPWIDPVIPNLSTDVNLTLSASLTQYEHDLEQTQVQLIWSTSGLNPALASASINQTTDLLTIVPVPDQIGSDVFTLVLSDGQGGLDSQSVTLNVTAISPATNWYVSWTGGNDNNSGTFSSPWKTLTHALQQGNRVMPGDTIWMRAGTYVENVILDYGTVANGTPDHLITIRAYQSGNTIETVVLQGSIRVYANNGGSDYGINHRYMNFRITGGNGDGYRFSGDKSTAVTEFINMEIDHHRSSGLYFGYGAQSFGTIRIINTKIHDNPPGHINGSSEGNSGIILSSRGHFEIEDCQIYENGDRTFSSYENKGINAQNQTGYTGHVKRTTIYNNVETGMDCPLVNGLIEDCIFYYNGMMDTVEVGPGNENGDSNLSMQSSGGGNIIRGCLFYNSGRYSLNIMNDNNVVYNCTLVDTLPYEKQSIQEDRAPLYLDPNSSGNIIKNCVIANYVPYVPGSDPDLYLAVLGGIGSGNSYLENHLDNNEYYAPHHPTGKFIKIAGMSSYNLTELRAAFPNSGSDVHSISNNPLFVNQNAYNYQIINGSPCVNTGTTQISTNITIPAPEYNGNAPDVGYWETGTAPANTPPYIDPVVPNLSTPEDVVLTFDLTPYEHDLEQPGAQLIWSASGLNPTLAAAIINASTDVITITPVANANGSDLFTLILSDGAGGLDSQSVTLTVTGVNDPPFIDPVVPNVATVEDSTITFDLTPYEHDLEQPGAQLIWSASGLNPTLAAVIINASTDVITITPVANANGSDLFTLILSDGAGGLDSQSVTLTISPEGNNAPEINPEVPDGFTKEDQLLNVDLSEYATDPDPGDHLTWSITGANPQMIMASVDTSTSQLTIQPLLNANGIDTLLLTLRDQGGLTDTQNWIINVIAINDTPWIQPPVPDSTFMGPDAMTISLVSYGHDVEDQPQDLMWGISQVDPALFTAIIDNATKSLILTPTQFDTVGVDTMLLSLTDTGGLSDTQELVIERVGFMEVSLHRVGPHMGRVPDVTILPGETPHPIDLRSYVVLGAEPFKLLIFHAEVLRDTVGLVMRSPMIKAFVRKGKLVIIPPASDWMGSSLVSITVTDHHKKSDRDTIRVTISQETQQDRHPGQGDLEIWQLAETSQIVHADTFYVHPTNMMLPDGFACFQLQGGQYPVWQDAEDITELSFPLVSNSPNQLSVRVRYTNGRIGSVKQLTVNEDSTPPAAPTGLKLKINQQNVAAKK
ncbi:MAG: tandem-95 repeat protein [bacterium]|nr:tandem-95 repeat protein [bacterium]